MDVAQRPRLTVIAASTEPWPAINVCLKSVCAQAMEAEAELLIAYREPDGFPPAASRPIAIIRKPPSMAT